MNIGIIDIGWFELDATTLKTKALGGSETWLMQISKEFSKNHNVDVYCNAKEEFKDGNVNYIPVNKMILSLYKQEDKYDFVILNRVVNNWNTNIIALLKQYNVTQSVYLQLHDLSLLINDNIVNMGDNDTIVKNLLMDPIVKGIVTLNEWHGNNLLLQYPVLKSKKFIYIANGVDLNLFKYKNNKNRDNRILWSSCLERGLDILIKYIYPIVKREVPDFGIDIAGYNDLSALNINSLDINVLGNLSKDQLYKEMSKHKCWFYPGTFAETFCITLLENILNGVTPISPFTYGTRPTISEEYANELWEENVDFSNEGSPEFSRAIQIASQKIISILKDNNYRIDEKLVKRAKQFTWDKSVQKYIDAYNENKETQYKYDGVFLAMTANSDFFKQARQNVEETWAKDLIENKYPRHKFFFYTSCDEQHPKPCVDGHTIYVDAGDDLRSTYSKTKQAILMLQKLGITYKYLYRTNTSVYVNVPKLISEVTPNHDELAGEYVGYYVKEPGEDKFRFLYNSIVGLFYGMHERMVKKIFFNCYDEHICLNPVEGDDITIGRITRYLGINYKQYKVNKNLTQTEYMRYKCCLPEDYDEFNQHHELFKKYTDDPNVVLNNCIVQVRSLYNGEERITKGKEFEHMCELHNAFIKNKENQ